jgi:hypothetical protein
MGRVVRLEFRRADAELSIEIDLLSDKSTLEHFRFFGAHDVVVRSGGGELNQRLRLFATDVRGRGMELTRFLVKDYEEEFISFACIEIHRNASNLFEIGTITC